MGLKWVSLVGSATWERVLREPNDSWKYLMTLAVSFSASPSSFSSVVEIDSVLRRVLVYTQHTGHEGLAYNQGDAP